MNTRDVHALAIAGRNARALFCLLPIGIHPKIWQFDEKRPINDIVEDHNARRRDERANISSSVTAISG